VVRPLGGILFGIMGDRFGVTRMVATLLMIGSVHAESACCRLCPDRYWAPALLVAMRVVQGLGAGAEYGGAVIFWWRTRPRASRFWGSFAPLGVSVAICSPPGAFAW